MAGRDRGVRLKCVIEQWAGERDMQGRGVAVGHPLSISLQHIGKALVLLCTVLLFTFLNNFFP